jgi:hypothetical protein
MNASFQDLPKCISLHALLWNTPECYISRKLNLLWHFLCDKHATPSSEQAVMVQIKWEVIISFKGNKDCNVVRIKPISFSQSSVLVLLHFYLCLYKLNCLSCSYFVLMMLNCSFQNGRQKNQTSDFEQTSNRLSFYNVWLFEEKCRTQS